MGYYVNVYAKQGCEQQINELWSRAFPEESPLIATKDWIEGQIAYIKNDPEQVHIANWCTSVNAWNKGFPIHAEGRGQIFIGSIFATETNDFSDEPNTLRKQIQWAMDHRFLFSEITGLQDAAESLDMAISCDAIENGRDVTYEQASFASLPIMPKSFVYRLCVEHQNPRFWEAYLNFKESQDWENWSVLRHFLIPGELSLGRTVWQGCEALATQLDHKNYGLEGRYRDGHHPDLWAVDKAISSEIKARLQEVV